MTYPTPVPHLTLSAEDASLPPASFASRDLTVEVLRLAAEHPEARYEPAPRDGSDLEACSYTRGYAGDAPGCLFGQALRNLGYPVELLEEGAAIATVSSLLGLETHPLWERTQSLQDNSSPWDTATEDLREDFEGTVVI